MSPSESSPLHKSPQPTPFSPSNKDLPPEIIHEICMLLQPTEVANLRLLGRRVAGIGLHYLLPEAHLIIKPSSFTRLAAQSRHAVVGQNIKSLFFETVVICEDRGFDLWKQEFLEESSYVHGSKNIPEEPCYCIFDEQKTMGSCAEPTDKELEVAYGYYKRATAEQEQVAGKDFWSEEMGEMLKRMPQLREVVISSSGIIRPFSRALMRAFPFCVAGDKRWYGPRHPRQDFATGPVRSLLKGLALAGSRIESLQIGCTLWGLLDQSDADLECMRAAFRTVKALDLRFVGYKQPIMLGGVVTDIDSVEWAKFAGSGDSAKGEIGGMGRLQNLLAAAPELESLDIHVSSQEMARAAGDPPADFSYVVGPLDQHLYWPKLQSASFTAIRLHNRELMTWCKKHAATLKKLKLVDVRFSHECMEDVVPFLRREMMADDFHWHIQHCRM